MTATIILLCYNGAAFLRQCLQTLYPLPDHYQLLIVDNGSRDDSVAIAQEAAPGAVIVENGKNYGFSGGMNIGLRLALGLETMMELALRRTDTAVLLNQDTQCLPGWHAAILEPFTDPSVGAVGCKIYDPDGVTIQHVGGGIYTDRATTYHLGQGEQDAGQYETVLEVLYATGAALALRGAALRQIGLFDERFNPAYMEEVDLCMRLRQADYRVVVNPAARLLHHDGASTPHALTRNHLFNRGRLLFVIKHRPIAWLVDVFARAERAYIIANATTSELSSLKRAYFDAILRLPDWCHARQEAQGTPVKDEDYIQLLDMLVSLRNQCVKADHKGSDLWQTSAMPSLN